MVDVSRRTILKGAGALTLASTLSMPNVLRAQEQVLRIGQLGVMSGPEASWGLVNRYCAEATANMWNARGGVEIGGQTYRIEVVSVDDRNDPRLSVSGAERLTSSEGIRYIIGPNMDATATSVRPVAEANGAIYIPYAFARSLYSAPAENAILGMIASYQVAPIMYDILKTQRGAERFAFVARNDTDGLSQRDEGLRVAEELGLEIVTSQDTYEANVTDFFPIMSNAVSQSPDVIVLSAAAPAHAPQMMRAARELGYQGLFACESAQDIAIINEVAGQFGDGLVSIGGASTPEIRSEYMEQFIEEYTAVAGEWNDEAGTKVYALEILLATLQAAGPDAIEDIEVFKAAIPDFSMPNPFLREEAELTYVGEADYGQKRQIGVPMVITETSGGEFTTLAISSVA